MADTTQTQPSAPKADEFDRKDASRTFARLKHDVGGWFEPDGALGQGVDPFGVEAVLVGERPDPGRRGRTVLKRLDDDRGVGGRRFFSS